MDKKVEEAEGGDCGIKKPVVDYRKEKIESLQNAYVEIEEATMRIEHYAHIIQAEEDRIEFYAKQHALLISENAKRGQKIRDLSEEIIDISGKIRRGFLTELKHKAKMFAEEEKMKKQERGEVSE